ncbi:MAG: lipopolysaccharide transport periplasmic protein LptA [Gammaproteobacteria bacterium]|nr:lipopolysaccharide transport periplasmic protein LptA [Gammaproteobacteria bacterium]
MSVIRGVMLSLVLISVAQAQVDSEQPIYIESDSLDIDDTRGVSTYRGNVQFKQGGNQLWADEVVIHSRDRRELDKMVATGKPARFHQAPAPGKAQETNGEAEQIEYQAMQGVVVLDGTARLSQGDNVFTGNRIEYETEQRLVRAGKATSTQKPGRVKVVIQPRKKPDAAGSN